MMAEWLEAMGETAGDEIIQRGFRRASSTVEWFSRPEVDSDTTLSASIRERETDKTELFTTTYSGTVPLRETCIILRTSYAISTDVRET